MYEAVEDPYCYSGTAVLRNKLDIRDATRLEAFEEEITRERAAEPLPEGQMDLAHFQAVHRHLFRDVYSWAAQLRTVRISRGDSAFCYPEYIPNEGRKLFSWLRDAGFLHDLSRVEFADRIAHFLGQLNAIHAFRDGNGRAQMAFASLLAASAGHPLHLQALEPERFLDAMIRSFQGDEAALAREIGTLL